MGTATQTFARLWISTTPIPALWTESGRTRWDDFGSQGVSIPVTPLFEAQLLMSPTVGKAEAAMSSAAPFRLSITNSGQPYFARI